MDDVDSITPAAFTFVEPFPDTQFHLYQPGSPGQLFFFFNPSEFEVKTMTTELTRE